MSNGEEQADFNRAYERACSVVAIADSHSATDAMKELLLQCFLLDKPQQPNSPAHLQALLQSLFGLPSSEAQVRASLASLVEAESLVTTGSDVRLSVGVQHDLTRRMEETVGLEHDIRDSWLAETSDYFPELPQDALWPALQEYLKQAFVRHGILTAALFDQSVNIGQDYVSSLTSMMTEVVAKRFDPAHQEAAGAALTQFLSSVTEQLPRAKYITQLANGTFNYYSLAQHLMRLNSSEVDSAPLRCSSTPTFCLAC